MYQRTLEDYFGDEARPYNKIEAMVQNGEISATPSAVPGTPGTLSGSEGYDLLAVSLVAGQTYTFSYRGTVTGGISDPYLALFNPTLTAVISEDDDGGFGRSSQITYTPTASGTYYLYATSWYTLEYGDPTLDTGGYTINMWSPEADVPGSSSSTLANILASISTAVPIGLGTYYGNIDAAGDNDYFKIDVEAGKIYTFNYSGGVSGAADFNGEPGENLAQLRVYTANGTLVGSNLNYESATGYYSATTSGTVYLRVTGYQATTGGYTIDVGSIVPDLTRDPLEAFNWDTAVNVPAVNVGGVPTVFVYFGAAGESFGTGETTYGWTQAQKDAVMHALNNAYTPLTGFNYVVTTDLSQATFRMQTVQNNTYGARFYPQDPSYGALKGIGSFNLLSGGFGADPNSLLPGGFSYGVILHEFGHAHGIAHPHDTGGGSEIMQGVFSSTGSLGVFDLNQGVYSVMSYNDGWVLHPDGTRTYSAATRSAGWSETLGAFDIAVLQQRGYAGNANYHNGNDVYTLSDTQADASYQTILDMGGNDTIQYVGTRNVQIDLLAATLDYSATGGGAISFASGVWGGYTIANGVVIENATGGSGADVLLGNASDNVLTGNDGNDTLVGRGGNDTANYATAGAGVTVDLVAGTATGGAGNDTLNSIENVIGSAHADTITGDGLANVLSGLAGNDTLIGGAGDDTFDGGADNDTVSYLAAAAAVVASLTSRTASGEGADTFTGVENLTGSGFGDSLTGDANVNILDGAGGNDSVSGQGGNDTLNGGAGDDTLSGDAGDDAVNGGDGVDTASYASASAAVTASLASGTATGGGGSDTLSSIESLIGSGYNDTLTGDSGANTLSGGVGDDAISGGDGNDTLNGDDGNDTLNGDGGDDALNGGLGNDVLAGGLGNDALNGGDGTDTATYAAASGSVTVDLVAGTATGGAGNDTLSSIENVIGSAHADTITGDGLANILSGLAGNDRIIANGGDDFVLGGNGLDVVTLGAGNDTFKAEFTTKNVVLKSGTMSVDIITDFDTNGNDLIDVSGLGLTYKGTAVNKAAGDLTYKQYDSLNGAENALGFDIDVQPGAAGLSGPVTVVYGNLDGGTADFAIILLNSTGVDASDFIFGSSSSMSAGSGGFLMV